MGFDQVKGRTGSEEILNHRAALAAQIVELQFVRTPGLRESFGAEGIGKSLRDAEYSLRVLGETLATGDKVAFGAYLVWLDKVLGAAGLKQSVLNDHLDCMRETFSIEVSPETRELAMDFISSGQGLLASSRAGTTP